MGQLAVSAAANGRSPEPATAVKRSARIEWRSVGPGRRRRHAMGVTTSATQRPRERDIDSVFRRMLLSVYEIECDFHFHLNHDAPGALFCRRPAEHHAGPGRARARHPAPLPPAASARDPDRGAARAAGHQRLHRHRRLRRAHPQRPLQRPQRGRHATPGALRGPQLHPAASLLRRARGRARGHLRRRSRRVRGRAGLPRLPRLQAAQLPRRRHHHPDGDHQRLSRAADLQRRRPPRDRSAHHPVDVARARRRHLRRVARPALPGLRRQRLQRRRLHRHLRRARRPPGGAARARPRLGPGRARRARLPHALSLRHQRRRRRQRSTTPTPTRASRSSRAPTATTFR